ncbi:VOC family protein [Salibacter halophilus]|uniref:VOC family protein n=1 Tax=Salibacter halophilus TaxID=1803916 RepID=A0A6N6M2F2_9FLAO|nr:VOC family protein [Salibacter halophilus]KAB1063215.1 VOC family protein [Salibacter halophilus]
MAAIISGIQQIGIGVENIHTSWKWYRKVFGMNTPVFDDDSTAELMLPYTGGKPRDRRAVLAMNMQGGGGFEIWQYKCRKPQPAKFDVKWGDAGILATKIKTDNSKASFNYHKNLIPDYMMSDLHSRGKKSQHYYVKDLDGNIFELTETDSWFKNKLKTNTGGVHGVVIGCSDIEKSLELYKNILDYDKVVFDESGVFEDWEQLNAGKERYRRVVLQHSKPRKGSFSRLLGPSEVELVQPLDREPQKIYEDRMWGDLGFIHICFDVKNMESLKERCAQSGFDFTVDSANSFDMGKAAGRFAYIEDPDGTLIEFVETHKLPIIEKLGWYMDISTRPAEKPLPNWMLRMLELNRVKD